MKVEIKHRVTGEILLSADVPDGSFAIRRAIEQLVSGDPHQKWRRGEEGGVRANLADANLARANLAGTNLADADLARAYLADAYLAGAYLAGADLADARNAPTGVERVDPPEPYVRRAPTAEALAEIARRYRERHPEIPVVENLDARILEAVTTGAGVLEMSNWHGVGGVCGTTHCRAGWAIHFAGERGHEMERKHGSQRAGAMIYRASTGRVPHFFATNERAMEDIRACAAQSAEKEG